MEKSCRKWAPKASPRPFFIFVNNQKQPLDPRNSFKNKIFWKRIKTLKKVFPSNSFNEEIYQKQKGPGTSDKSLFRLRNKFTKIYLLFIYCLTKFDSVI